MRTSVNRGTPGLDVGAPNLVVEPTKVFFDPAQFEEPVDIFFEELLPYPGGLSFHPPLNF